MFQKRFFILFLCACLCFSAVGCSLRPEQAPETTLPPETVPAETIPPNGNPKDVTCLGSYTVTGKEAADSAETVVATVEDAKLTNGVLQVYYWMEVSAYRQANRDVEPDFTRGLDTQVCAIDDSVATWQQYFLREALNTWHARQALVLKGQKEGIPTEDTYDPDLEKHAEYLSDKPATKYLYGYSKSYQPNELHQAYLDSIPQQLDTLASESGFAGAEDMAAAIAGPGADGTDLTDYADLMNRAYMYFTEIGYSFEPTEEDVTAFCGNNQSATGEKAVQFRHILLIPEGAQVAADGTVSCSEDAWERCRVSASELVAKWQQAVKRTRFAQYAVSDPAEARFSETAKNYSADAGSRANGGLYVNIRKGQLIQELEDWCFDSSRQHGDVEILRSPCGYHILFFSGATEDWYAAAEADLISEMYAELTADAMSGYPMEVTYSAIRLGQAPDNGSFIQPSDLLYPDVAHQRFPSMPLYLQQDYPDAPYGNYKLSSHGCGITTLAMVASYLADDELTPPELAARYGYYCGVRGTEIVIFDDTPAEMGFHLKKRSGGWDEIQAAIENGQVVVSLQYAGYWTSGGHYLAITHMNEDGKFVIRDSNLLNYKRIPAHVEDAHTRGSITQAGQYYWIYEPKVTRISACARCGETDMAQPPQLLFRQDYRCAKCLDAVTRRDNFLNGITG